ncbi:MAG TPA: ribosome biogenesis/translation initiation ATPase RLI [Candidatus Deferrimicrobium sp.]|nr:ribosome biogenesis/translation initiation ATPase RLI [Candidatus Deferrimicrobium sp.]
MRVAVLNQNRCKSKDCGKECIKFCPLVRTGVDCIYLKEGMKYPHLVEILCNGCGLCVKKCPFHALSIVNLPEELKSDYIHRYGKDTFVLFRLPPLIPGKIVGIIGPNGAGKSTALKILSGEIKPNLGDPEDPPEWDEIIKYFRGSELQAYFQQLSENRYNVIAKPQYITKLPEIVEGQVSDLLGKVDERGLLKEVRDRLNLEKIWERDIKVLSGGELQRVSIAAAILRERDVYLFDEPSSFLDVRERLEAAKLIRQLGEKENKIVGVVEHDLTICDYITDLICILYGIPGVYGIVSQVHNTNAGLNLYLRGELPSENIRFRNEPIVFNLTPEATDGWASSEIWFEYPEMMKDLGGFTLTVAPGTLHRGEVIGLVGRNGLGKTTLLNLLTDYVSETNLKLQNQTQPEEPVIKEEKNNEGIKAEEIKEKSKLIKLVIKPQHLKIDFDGTVELFLKEVAGKTFHTSLYNTEIIRPFGLETIMDHYIKELSGGELQKVVIAKTLSHMDANLIFMDEPSAFLDSEARLIITKSIKRIIKNRKISAFIVEHDILCVDFLSDSLIVFSGVPGVHGVTSTPVNLRFGMNKFLKDVEVTFRRDAKSQRPRVNKMGSELDRKQKAMGEYYYISLKK